MPEPQTKLGRLVRKHYVKSALADISDSTLYKKIQEGELPPPVHFGKISLWDREAIDKVVADLLNGGL